MNRTITIFLLSSYFFICCNKKDIETEKSEFKLPVVVNSELFERDSIRKYEHEVNYLTSVYPTFIGKFKFNDSIDINPKKKDTSLYNINVKKSEDLKKINQSGLELITDYETTVFFNWFGYESIAYFNYYPVYLVNSTATNKILFGKDSHVFGIQEAQDIDNYNSWKPIEAKAWDFCGNGHWHLIIRPNEFGLVLMPKYKGDYKTKLRTRIKNGDNIIVSNSYYGVINKSQFKIKDSSYVQRRLNDSNGLDAFSLFYGAVPYKEDWAVLSAGN
ncbi:hypothetical protein [uncultured Winogradskyella sp.]|uniref:hypothetical protein n=1 Tax=uncultured Winogradskyella sp. TaxID=395353 RepID=UPI002628EA45|nr:hypothetical protein [uncultured Winogradskyella sp.]